eukprot:Amastigsp_a676486_1099.p3 type:complete len:187 gc:universal Amastigsp_a676486_1099:583-23(-)
MRSSISSAFAAIAAVAPPCVVARRSKMRSQVRCRFASGMRGNCNLPLRTISILGRRSQLAGGAWGACSATTTCWARTGCGLSGGTYESSKRRTWLASLELASSSRRSNSATRRSRWRTTRVRSSSSESCSSRLRLGYVCEKWQAWPLTHRTPSGHSIASQRVDLNIRRTAHSAHRYNYKHEGALRS